jgi:hypothetical protein
MKLTLHGRRAGASGHGVHTRRATTITPKQRARLRRRAAGAAVRLPDWASLFLMGGLGRLRRPRFLSAKRG